MRGSVLLREAVIPCNRKARNQHTMRLRYACALALSCSAFALLAQPNLTAATSIPPAGLTVTYNTANAYASTGATGANVTWEHWNLLVPATSSQDIQYLAPSVTPSSALVPAATLLSTDGGSDTTFWAATGQGLEMVGTRVDPALGGVLSFTDPSLELKLPCTFGTTWSDVTSDSYTASGFPVTRTGTITGNADAYGSLELPLNVDYPAVLRVHVRREVTDASAVVTTNRIANIYSFYITTQTTPIVILQEDSTRINAGSWAVTRRQMAVGNPGMVGVEESGADGIRFHAFPNPTTDVLNVSFAEGTAVATNVELIDATGRRALNTAVQGGRVVLDAEGLKPGLYTMRVFSGETVIGTSRITIL